MNLEYKIDIVKDILKNKKVAIGFSGGADSTLLAYLSSKVAKDTLTITIDNNLFPTDFINNTKKITNLFGLRHKIIDLNFFEDEEFILNNPKRCYSCRNKMYSIIEKVAHENGFDFICDGNNISDLVNDRPGILITYKKKFKTPFIDAKLDSREIHDYLNKNNIPYSKSTTCLATRIPTNTPITKEKIDKISYYEDYILKNTNCQIVKIRDFEKFLICEVDNIPELIKKDKFKQINDKLKNKGYNIALNLSEINDDEEIKLNYKDNSFSYKLPFTINIENTKKQLKNDLVRESDKKLETNNIEISENGLITGKNFKTYENALNDFSELLSKLRRNI